VLPPLVVRLRINSGGCADPAQIECPAALFENPEPNENGNESPVDEGNGDPNTEQ
jgi:hypothetical protein